MKKIRQDFADTLRPEYKRSDFGDFVKGKYATTQLEFRELVELLLACIGEDEGLQFFHHSIGNNLADRQKGDWTYEIDNSNQITLRYWLSEFGNLEESLANPCCITASEERTELQDLLEKHVQSLRNRVMAL